MGSALITSLNTLNFHGLTCFVTTSFVTGQRWVGARRFATVYSEVATDALAATEKINIESLIVDSEMTGTVKRISDFGAFIDFGCKADGE